jgi:tetraacyldisaccharide 4'-kinase
MDDGFQNPSLAKDLSILVVDGKRGIGNARVLPAGPLRAPLDPQLDRAQAIMIVGDGASAAPIAAAAQARALPTFHARLVPDQAAVAALASQKILAFAGIGDPEKFFATLAASGIDAPVTRAFPDHHRYSPTDAITLVREAERNRLQLLTTEKDLARLQGDATAAALAQKARALPVTLAVTEGDALQNFVIGAARATR